MTSLSSISVPKDSLAAAQSAIASETDANSAQLKAAEETENVAKKFESLLIHNMLKAMRKTTFGENTSNERAMYDDMFDQHLAKSLSESGGLGIASSITRQLNAQQGINSDTAGDSIDQIKQSIDALSNRPSTLAYNGQLSSSFTDNSTYQTLAKAQLSMNSLSPTAITSMQSTADAKQRSLSETKQAFVSSIMPDAIRTAPRLGVEPEIVVAIAALETGWGQYMIKDDRGANSHNLFGIKAHSLDAPYTMHKTTEFIGNKPTTVDAAFRRYNNDSSSVSDFADFLLSNPRYRKALAAASDNKAFLQELQQAGYATDPEYATKALEILRQVKAIQQSPTL